MTCTHCGTMFRKRDNGKCPFCHRPVLSPREVRERDAQDRAYDRMEYDNFMAHDWAEYA